MSGIRAGEGSIKKSGQIRIVLIIEDIEWIRSGMRKAVERQGFRVAEARNDAEAFAYAELQSIDLILTEEEVPTFTNVMTSLREHATLSKVPVVIVNPDADDGTRLDDAYVIAEYTDISSFLSVLHP